MMRRRKRRSKALHTCIVSGPCSLNIGGFLWMNIEAVYMNYFQRPFAIGRAHADVKARRSRLALVGQECPTRT